MRKTGPFSRTLTWFAGVALLACVTCNDALAVGETGAQFLKIGVGVRSMAMGEAYSAIADDASAVYWNPAGLARQDATSVLATYGMWFEDMGHHTFAVAAPTDVGYWGGLVCYSPSGDIPRVDGDLNASGEYDAYDFSGSLAFANRIGKALSYGVGAKLIQSSIEDESATGYAADVGLLYEPSQVHGFTLGLAVQNLGPDLTFISDGDPLPLTVRGGVAFDAGSFVVAADASKPRDNDVSVHLGAEYVIAEVLALRAGFLTRPEMESAVTFGLGVTWRRLSVGYAYVPFAEIEGTHHVSAGLSF